MIFQLTSLGGDGVDGETPYLVECSTWNVMLKKCAEKLSSKFKYEIYSCLVRGAYYYVYGTPAQKPGNGGKGGDNGIGGSSGQIELINSLMNEPSKCRIFHKNGK